MKIILASASLGRKKILTDLGLKFTIMPAKIDEREITAKSPLLLVKKIAKAKAEKIVGARFSRPWFTGGRIPAPTIIIAADSMIYFKGKTYGKPKSKTEAKIMLSRLSGQTHEFITGLCLISTKPYIMYQKSCKSKITFEKFSQKEIDDYVKIANVTSFAGGFAPELKGGEIIKRKMKIKGSVSNVLGGLPLEILVPILKKNGFKI